MKHSINKQPALYLTPLTGMDLTAEKWKMLARLNWLKSKQTSAGGSYFTATTSWAVLIPVELSL
jgi:hypothetical protein